MATTTAPNTQIKPFLDDNFLLDYPASEQLYHEYARQMPILDYHNHLPPEQIANNHQFDNLTQIWLNGDHYKWRAMRTLGVDERYITGEASDEEKFEQWAATVPYTMRNPLYHWTHLELKRYFGIDQLLHPGSAKEIYEQCNAMLQQSAFRVHGLLEKMNVEVVCTTDDPTDSLEYHQRAFDQEMPFRMLPAFRPDKAILIQAEGFPAYLEQLGEVVDSEIRSLIDLLSALRVRADFFHEMGCRLSDHGLERVYAVRFTEREVDAILQKRLLGDPITMLEAEKFMSAMLYHLGKLYHEKGWTQQYHLGALRNNSSRMMRKLGPDTGFDSIGDFRQANALARFLDRLDSEDKLPKTILYNLNSGDNELMATMIGNFNDGSMRGKMQFGSAWWYHDQKDGMEKQMNTLSNMGLLSCFVGMLTDSRSFLSFPRHEYFRRILCNLIGRDVHHGELPNDMDWLGSMVQDICYRNAKAYFGF